MGSGGTIGTGGVVRSVLLNLTSRITNRASRAAAQIVTLTRTSAFWRSTYLIVLLLIWFWLASKFWMLLYFWKHSGEAGTLIVILGVTGELVADLWYEERKKTHRAISGLSTLILILGLVIELYSNGRVSALSDEITAGLESQLSHTLTALGPAMERASEANATAEAAKASVKGYDKQIAEAKERAAIAERRAGDANALASTNERESASLKRQAAILIKQAEDERMARDQLEKEVAWRHISQKEAEAIRSAIPAHLTGFKIEVRHLLSDPEAARYASEIADALRPILDVDGSFGELEPWGKIPQGVGLYVRSMDIPGAVEIQRALKAGGVDAPGALLSQAAHLESKSGILIFVWPKPAPAEQK